jgi:HPr kinase/phosphorylase
MRAVDRLKGSHSTQTILGLEIPEVTIPVAPGREMAILVEAAVRQHNLREKGYDAAEHFIARQQRAIVDETEEDPVEAGRRRVKR